MRFRVDRDVLADAVAWASRALPARPVIPVLSGLLLRAAEDGLTLSCFDYEVSARVAVDAEIDEPGTVLVPGRLLAEITRSLPGLPVEFADDPDGVSLTCGSAAFTLVTLPVEDYPDLPGLPQTAGTVDGGALAAAIGQVAPASSRDDTLPLLTGVNVEVNGGTMTLAATDRYRLAVRDLPWDPAQPGMSGAYLVPARTLVDAARTMSPGVPVTIKLQSGGGTARAEGDPGDPGRGSFGGAGGGAGSGGASAGGLSSGGAARAGTDAMIGFETDGRRLTTRLIAGEFIKYRSRFPAEFRCRADMPVGPFTEAVKRVSLVAERGTAVRLVFGGGTVTIEAGTQGRARAREVVPAQFEGTEPEIAFSPHFLLDGITASAVSAAASEEGPGSETPGDPVQHEDGPKVAARKADGRKVDGRKTDGRTKAGSARGGKAGSKRKEPAKRGDSGAARGDHADQADQDGARIRLEFSSATKPAVITGVRAGTATTVVASGAATQAAAPVVALASVGAGARVAGSAEASGADAGEAAGGDQAAGESGGQGGAGSAGAAGGGPAGGQGNGAGGDLVTPEFRYLVVPLRVAARQ